jgi:hypothetical protein
VRIESCLLYSEPQGQVPGHEEEAREESAARQFILPTNYVQSLCHGLYVLPGPGEGPVGATSDQASRQVTVVVSESAASLGYHSALALAPRRAALGSELLVDSLAFAADSECLFTIRPNPAWPNH